MTCFPGIHFPILFITLSAADHTPEIMNIIQPTGIINNMAATSSIHPSALPVRLFLLFRPSSFSFFSGKMVFISFSLLILSAAIFYLQFYFNKPWKNSAISYPYKYPLPSYTFVSQYRVYLNPHLFVSISFSSNSLVTVRNL